MMTAGVPLLASPSSIPLARDCCKRAESDATRIAVRATCLKALASKPSITPLSSPREAEQNHLAADVETDARHVSHVQRAIEFVIDRRVQALFRVDRAVIEIEPARWLLRLGCAR
jgi:hypothetical protein